MIKLNYYWLTRNNDRVLVHGTQAETTRSRVTILGTPELFVQLPDGNAVWIPESELCAIGTMTAGELDEYLGVDNGLS